MLQYKVVDLLKDVVCISPIVIAKDSIFSHCLTSGFLGVSLGSIPAGNGLRHDTDQQIDKQQMTRTMHWDHAYAFMILAQNNTCFCIVATPQTNTSLVAFDESQVDCILPGTCNIMLPTFAVPSLTSTPVCFIPIYICDSHKPRSPLGHPSPRSLPALPSLRANESLMSQTHTRLPAGIMMQCKYS